jgi:hypothetical protein
MGDQAGDFTMENAPSLQGTGWIAIATGVIGILALVSLMLFFAVGEPFGTINDSLSGLLGVASAVLAWRLYAEYHTRSPLLSQIGLVLALVGAAVAVVGSVLVIFRFTGWLLAGFYTGLGYAFLGAWLAIFCYTLLQESSFPHGLLTFGLVTGILMAFGLIGLLGFTAGIDSMTSMPWYLNLAYVGYLGSALYLIWAIWLGRVLLTT